MPYNVSVAGEKKAHARRFIVNNFSHSVSHVVPSIEAMTATETDCSMHGPECDPGMGDPRNPPQVDVLCVGIPCPPYSPQRPKRWEDGSVKSHPQFKTAEEVQELIHTLKPACFICEEVVGWDRAESTAKKDEPTPCEVFKKDINKKGVFTADTVEMKAELFVKMTRDRCLAVVSFLKFYKWTVGKGIVSSK